MQFLLFRRIFTFLSILMLVPSLEAGNTFGRMTPTQKAVGGALVTLAILKVIQAYNNPPVQQPALARPQLAAAAASSQATEPDVISNFFSQISLEQRILNNDTSLTSLAPACKLPREMNPQEWALIEQAGVNTQQWVRELGSAIDGMKPDQAQKIKEDLQRRLEMFVKQFPSFICSKIYIRYWKSALRQTIVDITKFEAAAQKP